MHSSPAKTDELFIWDFEMDLTVFQANFVAEKSREVS